MEASIHQTDPINSATRDAVLAEFQAYFHSSPDYIVRAPGRVNLLGEHVDYNDGIVLPIAIDRTTWLAFRANGSEKSNLLAKDLGRNCSFTPSSLHHKAGLGCPGMDAVYSSNIPNGSGLSSSASIEMAFVLAWQTLAGWGLQPMQRALLGKKAENLYVGVQSGIMDQFASACGKENSILVLDCRSLEWYAIPLPTGNPRHHETTSIKLR